VVAGAGLPCRGRFLDRLDGFEKSSHPLARGRLTQHATFLSLET
jgi:hypothetical protein